MVKHRIFWLFLLISISFAAEGLIVQGSPAPTFVLPSTTGKREYLRIWSGEKLMKPYLNSVKHRIVLSFWSATCLPCMKEIPELHRFAEKYADDSLKVFLINLDKMSSGEVKKFMDLKGWTLPSLLDPYKNCAKRYGVTAIPTLYVLSPDGKVEHAFTGIPEGVTTDEYLEQLIYPSDSLEVIDTSEMIKKPEENDSLPADSIN